MRLTQLFKGFFESERAGGIVLMACTAIALFLANNFPELGFTHFWHHDLGPKPIEFWINDGLMAIFFLLIGLEIEREIYVGELSDRKNTMIPFFAALGGALIPAAIHWSFNHGTDFQRGMGIPMATDIAFALGILSLLGNRVPSSLKIFLTALAIIDDLMAIIIIAVFYSKGFYWEYFAGSMLVFGILLLLNRQKVMHLWIYLVLGVVMWYFMLRSGIHATIAGVLLAFAIPFRRQDAKSPSHTLQHFLHYPVAFFILPLFALANTGIKLPEDWITGLFTTNGLGIILGLVLGKPIGVILFTYLANRWKIGRLPEGLAMKQVAGAGMLAGIG
ncbi:MAG: Na+/H+ antiporter NhaA, partial [Saprospiraceae bacterium]|nr:Na+/H+ antiporter NhaA [Saprospiraceae bacterium]